MHNNPDPATTSNEHFTGLTGVFQTDPGLIYYPVLQISYR